MYSEKKKSGCAFNHVFVRDSYMFYSVILMKNLEGILQKKVKVLIFIRSLSYLST